MYIYLLFTSDFNNKYLRNSDDNQHFYLAVIKTDTVIYDATKVRTPEIATDRLAFVLCYWQSSISSICTSFISIGEKD